MTTQVVFNVDVKVKARAMSRARREGIPFASVLKLATKAYADERLSVGVDQSERFNVKTARAVKAAMRDIRAGKNVITFKSGKEMDEFLLSR